MHWLVRRNEKETLHLPAVCFIVKLFEERNMKRFNKGLFTDLVKGLTAIEKPINDSQAKEGLALGLELLKRSNDPNYNLYKFLDCGHTALLQATHVRRNHFDCKTCLHERNVQRFFKSGDFLLFWTKTSYYKVLRECGHIVDCSVNNAVDLRGSCSLCFEEKLQKCADSNGYEYLGIDSGRIRKIRFKSCGHEKALAHSQIVKGNAVCRICQEDNYKKQAETVGLEFITRTKDSYANYILPCGCNKELRVDHAADGSWICDEHNESHYSKPSLVYLLEIRKDAFSWLKLGFAKNLELRTNGYGLRDADIVSVKTVPFETGRTAMLFEKKLHAELKVHRLSKNLMKTFHTFSGHTECYPVDVKDLIISELNKLENCSE